MSSSKLVASPVRHTKASSTTRRILKVASLGIAGLIAGLLAGCSSSVLHLFAFDQSAAPDTTLTASRRVENLETRQIPALRHAPVPHYTHPVPPNTRQAFALSGQADGGQNLAARNPAGRYNDDSVEITEQ